MQNRSIRRSRFATVIAATALSVVAAGCGATGGTGGGPTQVVSSRIAPQARTSAFLAQAAQTTGAIEAQKVELTVERDDGSGAAPLVVVTTGQIDAEAGRVHLVTQAEGETLEAVYEGESLYVKAPFGRVDTPWIRVSSPELLELADQLVGGLESDPGSFLAFLEGASGPVETLGTEEVRGVPTRHVAVEVDPAKVLDEAPADRREQVEEQLTRRGLSVGALAPIPAEAWIDDDGYVRRFTASFDQDRSGTVTVSIELFDFDQPVSIAVPPADQVTDLGDLGDLLDGEGGD